MNKNIRDAKITIEFDDGLKAEFAARVKLYDFREEELRPAVIYNDNYWQRMRLPDPPLWKIQGHSFGDIMLTIKS